MSFKHLDSENAYYVDLRSYSPEEALRLYHLIDSYDCDCFLTDCPYVYEVSWYGDDSLPETIGIPAQLVSRDFSLDN